ncbi:TRAP transporter substrate-binding protein DctP [Guyparkeria halopsychrophila]|uniref:TRAP transporter substrate-binding protein n=1 Tax=Guyparkeria halopsychrophila TaxID=3139421 RepID=UPI0037C52F11
MKRREFLTWAGAAGIAATALSGCNNETGDQPAATAANGPTAADPIRWKMVTTWPKNFPGLGTGANNIAKHINEMSGGRLVVDVYGAGEIVPALEVFDAVKAGTAEMGHGAAYYWQGKMPAAAFFAAMPFGLTANEMNGWLYHGEGIELWEELYAPHGIIPRPGGNTGPQMGGWFRKPIDSVEDFKGLKMRLPGIGGEVLRRLDVSVVNTPGGELFQALNDGTIDAAEWVGPFNDLAFGFHRAAKYYYAPGWQEPSATMEALINQEAFEALPDDLQAIVDGAIKMAALEMLSEFTARNNRALKTLTEEHGVELRYFSDEIMAALFEKSNEVLAEITEEDAFAKRVFESLTDYRRDVAGWTEGSEYAFLTARQRFLD